MQTQDKTYNGWTNYETWNCALWIDNNQGEQEYWRERAKDIEPIQNEFMELDRRKVAALAKALEAQFQDDAEQWIELKPGFFTDIFNAALREVNWTEIAEHLIEDAQEAWPH